MRPSTGVSIVLLSLPNDHRLHLHTYVRSGSWLGLYPLSLLASLTLHGRQRILKVGLMRHGDVASGRESGEELEAADLPLHGEEEHHGGTEPGKPRST